LLACFSYVLLHNFAEYIVSDLLNGDREGAWAWTLLAGHCGIVMLPMLLLAFAPPLLLALAGAATATVTRAALLCLAAEMLTNLHAFVVIACNHCGPDMYRFATPCRSHTAEFYLRCVYASVNFETGNDYIDTVYGWLNYQVEHHMFADVSALHYQTMQPLIKRVCQKHGVVYTQENALKRAWITLQCITGQVSMQSVDACLEKAEE